MKSADILSYLRNNKIGAFSIYDIAKLTGKNTKYTSLFLSKISTIKRIERGKYYVEGTDIYEIASHILKPSYISMESAFRYFNLITQMPTEIQLISSCQHKHINIEGFEIKTFKLNKNKVFGYHIENNVSIADIEKAIIDTLYFRRDYVYIEEAFTNALHSKLLDSEKLKTYAQVMGSKSLIKRLDLLLNKNQ